MKRSRVSRRCTLQTRSWFDLVFLLLLGLFLPMPVLAQGSAAAVPTRIVSLGPLLTENIFLLGAGERLVGNTIYCQRPEAARSKEKVGSVQELSIEKIVSLKPDLILASNLSPRQQMAQLRELGLRVEAFGQPASFADICTHLRRLGGLLGLQERAEAIIAQAQAQVTAVQQAVSPLPKQKVLLQVGASPLFSSVRTSFTNDFIELAGGSNIAGEQRSGAMKVEQVLALNPEVIVIAVMGSEHGIGAEEKKRWLQFATLDAVRDQRVHLLDPDAVCSPSPLTFASTLLIFARLIHPQAVIQLPAPAQP